MSWLFSALITFFTEMFKGPKLFYYLFIQNKQIYINQTCLLNARREYIYAFVVLLISYMTTFYIFVLINIFKGPNSFFLFPIILQVIALGLAFLITYLYGIYRLRPYLLSQYRALQKGPQDPYLKWILNTSLRQLKNEIYWGPKPKFFTGFLKNLPIIYFFIADLTVFNSSSLFNFEIFLVHTGALISVSTYFILNAQSEIAVLNDIYKNFEEINKDEYEN